MLETMKWVSILMICFGLIPFALAAGIYVWETHELYRAQRRRRAAERVVVEYTSTSEQTHPHDDRADTDDRARAEADKEPHS